MLDLQHSGSLWCLIMEWKTNKAVYGAEEKKGSCGFRQGGHRGEPFRGAYKITPSQISANLGLALRDQ